MEFLRSFLLPSHSEQRRRWGSPVWNRSTDSQGTGTRSPMFSFSNGNGSLLPGRGVRESDADTQGAEDRSSIIGRKQVVDDSPIAFGKQNVKGGAATVPGLAPGSPLENTKATDYATPEKYLENPGKIPSYYVFQSNMVTDEDLKPGMLRNLEVDKRLTLPTRTHIRFLITATDVIHSWAVPSLGIKADAIPGRLQRVHAFIQREGVYYGQCSELCGSLYGFMPIVVEAVSPETYAAHAKKWYRDE